MVPAFPRYRGERNGRIWSGLRRADRDGSVGLKGNILLLHKGDRRKAGLPGITGIRREPRISLTPQGYLFDIRQNLVKRGVYHNSSAFAGEYHPDGNCPFALWYMWNAIPICFRLFSHCARAGLRDLLDGSNNSPIRMAMMAITTAVQST